ncbi:MAG: hypothetical protein JWM74_503 [Myxococcaceae bacterium]|nr:hypothetical protein [Myxococcaceae bacterium]
MIKPVGPIASLFVPVVAVALSLASASHANTPLHGAVADFTSRIDSPGPYVMEVSSDNSIKMPSFQAVIRFHRAGPITGDTGNVRLRTSWDPDQASKTAQLFTTASWIRLDKTRVGIDNEVNGWAFDGKAISNLGWGLRDATNAYAYWCGGPKKYTIPGNIQVTVDGLTGPNTQSPAPTPISLEVRCTTVAPASLTGPIPPPLTPPAPTGAKPPPAPSAPKK